MARANKSNRLTLTRTRQISFLRFSLPDGKSCVRIYARENECEDLRLGSEQCVGRMETVLWLDNVLKLWVYLSVLAVSIQPCHSLLYLARTTPSQYVWEIITIDCNPIRNNIRGEFKMAAALHATVEVKNLNYYKRNHVNVLEIPPSFPPTPKCGELSKSTAKSSTVGINFSPLTAIKTLESRTRDKTRTKHNSRTPINSKILLISVYFSRTPINSKILLISVYVSSTFSEPVHFSESRVSA
jgi:hypothetical protein